MASLTVRGIETDLKRRLRIQAAENGRSMEEEVRVILRRALNQSTTTPENLARAIQTRFEPLGGVELELPARTPMRPPASFD